MNRDRNKNDVELNQNKFKEIFVSTARKVCGKITADKRKKKQINTVMKLRDNKNEVTKKNEVWKQYTAKMPTRIFNMAFNTGGVPEDWKLGIVPVRKKGNTKECGNYRRTLLTVAAKVCERLLETRFSCQSAVNIQIIQKQFLVSAVSLSPVNI